MLNLLGIKDYIFAGVVLALSIYIGFLKYEVSDLSKENKDLNTQIVYLETMTKAQVLVAEQKAARALKDLQSNKKKTEEQIKKLKEFAYDNNQTDCANAMSFARSFL